MRVGIPLSPRVLGNTYVNPFLPDHPLHRHLRTIQIPHRRHLKPFNASAPAVKLHHIWNLPLAITANNRGSYGISWSFHICHSQRDVETT